jgi:predicted nucleic acid-binding protein
VIILSDTSPLNYLILIGQVEILPVLFGDIVVPGAVVAELTHHGTPEVVRQWIGRPPKWLSVKSPTTIDAAIHLGRGETEAICLAMEFAADLLLMDDRRARREAESRGLSVAGTLNVLEAAAERGLLDFRAAIASLQATTFHLSDRVVVRALAADAARRDLRGE